MLLQAVSIFPSSGLTSSFWDFVDLRNLCGSSRPGYPIISSHAHPTLFESESLIFRIPFACRDRCGAWGGISCCIRPHSLCITRAYDKSWYCAGMWPPSSVTISTLTMYSMMPSGHAPSNTWHSPSRTAHASTTSSLAQRLSNAVARVVVYPEKACHFGYLTAFRQTWPICFWDLRPLRSVRHSQGCQSTVAAVDSRVSCHGQPKTILYPFIVMIKTSDLSTGLRRSNTEPRYWPFNSLHTSSPAQGGGECWFIW